MDTKSTALLVMAATAILSVVAAQEWRDGRATDEEGESTAVFPAPAFPQKGSVVPELALPVLGMDGPPWVEADTVRLSDFRGRWVYLDVFGSWCPPCRTKQPKMLEIARRLEDEGAVILGLLLEDSPQTAAEWLEANGGRAYPYLVLDEETKRSWGITGAPMGFLVSPEGRLERLCFGCSRGRDAVETLPDAIS